MSIEPHNVRTVSIRSVMPPKADKPKGVPIPESLLASLMAKEARAVRARFIRKWGVNNTQPSGDDANGRRKAEADARRDELAEDVMVLLAKRPWTSRQMRDHLMVSENRIRNALGYLRETGRTDFARKGNVTVWERRMEAAE